MQIEIARHERMAETGSSLLRLIQNNEMPLLDLMVREAVQNSLDAALPGNGYVQMDFNIRNFNRGTFTQHFEGIGQTLDEGFPNEEYRLMEIRDTFTYGLTGPLHDRECTAGEYGNLIKLIYHIGMPQQREGSGGSWGLGKTVYFRLGIGLVLYYTRVKNDQGEFVSRLAACLVEDEKKANTLLKNKGSNRGIAWWGESVGDNSTKPITNEAEIQAVLDSLGVRSYTGSETGTTIIIPFLRDDLRTANEFVSIDEEDENEEPQPVQVPWWHNSDEEYIAVALQRWYAPRLMNPLYPYGKWFRARVNDEGITKESFLSVFQIVQDLYNSVHTSQKANWGEKQRKSEIHCLPVNIRSTFKEKQTAGWICFVKVSLNELKMSPPDNQLDPWTQVYGRSLAFENNPALISFVRKPGMIVGYEYTGKWADGIPKTSPKEHIIGLFVANSQNTLIEQNPKNDLPFLLEEYIRGCEKADHTSWQDWAPAKRNPLIIERIQRNVVNSISKVYSDKTNQQPGKKNLVLGKLLADVLLPPEGFGSLSAIQQPRPKGGTGGGKPTGKSPKFTEIASPVYESSFVRMGFELYCGQQKEPLAVKLKILSETGEIEANTWEGDQGTGIRFPLKIESFTVDSIINPKETEQEIKDQAAIDQSVKDMRCGDLHLSLVESARFGQPCEILIHSDSKFTGQTIKGSVLIASEDRSVSAAFDVVTVSGGINS